MAQQALLIVAAVKASISKREIVGTLGESSGHANRAHRRSTPNLLAAFPEPAMS
jgi:hypothetical protein